MVKNIFPHIDNSYSCIHVTKKDADKDLQDETFGEKAK